MTVDIYSIGICHCSVCTDIEDTELLEEEVNNLRPAGVTLRWKISDESFKGGEPNPCSCEKYPDRKHYLFVC